MLISNTYTYNSLGLPTVVRDPLGCSVTNALGQLAGISTYDELGRRTTFLAHSGGPVVNNSYDAASRITNVTCQVSNIKLVSSF